MKNQDLKHQLDALPGQIAAVNAQIEAFAAKVRNMPQGADRWALEEWLIAECRLEPSEIRTRPTWLREDWLKSAMDSKAAARQYRAGGQAVRAEACEADAQLAEARAAWMAKP